MNLPEVFWTSAISQIQPNSSPDVKMSQPRKILFVSSNFPPVVGGSSVVYDQLCKNAGGQIIALSASRDYRNGVPWPDLPAIDAAKGYPIYRIPYLRPPETEGTIAGWPIRLLRDIFRDLPIMAHVLMTILALVVRHRIRVVCLGELIYGGWLVFPLRYIFGRTVLIYTHGEEISQDNENLLARRRGLFLHHAHALIAVSLFCKGQIISKYSIDPNKIHVINNGVDLNAYHRGTQNRTVWPEAIRNRHIILSVSRLVERKGQETLLRAMPKILEVHPDAHCVIVGGGPLEERLRAIVDEVGVGANCSILGPTPQNVLTEYFRNCDVFALPCRTMPDGDTEGFGLVFLEAGACGKPVVAGVAGGTVEAVADAETGLLVDGYNTSEVANAVTSLLSDPQMAGRLANEAWRRAQDCNWGAVAQKFLDVCHMPGPSPRVLSFPDNIRTAAHPTPAAPKSTVPNLLVTVDVEEEFSWQEFDRERHVVRGADALRQFHNDCRKAGISPVYLLTYPILMDERYRSFLQEAARNGEAEMGIHLHSWTTPPYWEQANAFTSYQCNLPDHVERRKLETLCREFEKCFGYPVHIHRAGRWGGGTRTSAMLEKLGITLDLSPSTGYSDRKSGGPDFTNLDGAPFWSGAQNKVLTVPASSVNYLRGPLWLSSQIFRWTRNRPYLQRRIWHRGKPVRFSPENADEETLFAMATEMNLRGLPTAVYTLHSTSLYAGGNPYSQRQGDAEALRQRSFDFLSRAVESKLLTPTTCKDLLAGIEIAKIAV
jgi:glycosyltransferase involved in cell wall biosynthesis